MGALIAILNKAGRDSTREAATMLKALKNRNVEKFGIASPSTSVIKETAEALESQKLNSFVAVGLAFSKILPHDKPRIIKLENAMLIFDGRIYPSTKDFFEKIPKTSIEAARNLLKVDGNFAFAIAESNRLIVGRDSLGVYPLYFGENEKFFAVASERKSLWKIGIEKTSSFPPGHLAFFDKYGFRFKKASSFNYFQTKPTTLGFAAKTLQRLLQQSIRNRISGLKDVAVAFSGGLDSSLIAFITKNFNVNVQLIHVSLKGQKETQHAKIVAEELKLPIHIHLYAEGDVEKTLPKVLRLIEEPNPIKASIGIASYWTAENSTKMGINVLLAGHGADELFGGYKRYQNIYLKHGEDMAYKAIVEDALKMHETNFERDFKIYNFHNVELRLPYATKQIVRFAAKIPIELKLERREDGERKIVLRHVAKNLGLPESVTARPKKAIQYSTGINNALKKLAKKEKRPLKEYLEEIFQTIVEEMKTR